ncbi:MAG: hypothetical protein FWH01_15145 [Oscillospiraceae bacterium]|nr:hypothetical protein [Oscillospiraceae bacterium]
MKKINTNKKQSLKRKISGALAAVMMLLMLMPGANVGKAGRSYAEGLAIVESSEVAESPVAAESTVSTESPSAAESLVAVESSVVTESPIATEETGAAAQSGSAVEQSEASGAAAGEGEPTVRGAELGSASGEGEGESEGANNGEGSDGIIGGGANGGSGEESQGQGEGQGHGEGMPAEANEIEDLEDTDNLEDISNPEETGDIDVEGETNAPGTTEETGHQGGSSTMGGQGPPGLSGNEQTSELDGSENPEGLEGPEGELEETEDLDEPEELEELEDELDELEDMLGLAPESEESDTGAIKGFLWDDGNGTPPTGWDGLFNGAEQPLVGYTVYLYAAGDTSTYLASALTGDDGVYIIEGLAPGSYMLALISETIDGTEYLLPLAETTENKFVFDWNAHSYLAFTSDIEVEGGQTVEGINGGLRQAAPIRMLRGGPIEIPIGADAKLVSESEGLGFELVQDNTWRNINFKASAEGKTYKITQNGISTTNYLINIPENVSLTVIISSTTRIKDTKVGYGAHLNLVLDGVNTIDSYIQVATPPESQVKSLQPASITIDKVGGRDEDHVLNISHNIITRAVIGGYKIDNTVYHGGTIVINGGTLNVSQKAPSQDKQLHKGALIGGGESGNSDITINGGIINAHAHDTGTGSAIGGGFNAKIGKVKINGGTVNASIGTGNDANGAAIGGGHGSNVQGVGDGYVTITGGTINASARTGAAIGGGMRGDGYVDIYGGDIRVRTNHTGAGIGSGGGANSSNMSNPDTYVTKAEVNISGGNIFIDVLQGAGIGNGSYQGASNPGFAYDTKGYVTITGGTIYIQHDRGNAVGSGQNNNALPMLTIDIGADIMAFGKGTQGTNFPGINTGDKNYPINYNQGDGYFVNANFDIEIGGADGLMIVVLASQPDVPVRIVEIPHKYRTFSFTTGEKFEQVFHVYTGTESLGVRQIVRRTDESGDIYSVHYAYKYYEEDHTFYQNYYRSLAVMYGAGGTYALSYPVYERFVDINGAEISGETLEIVPIGNLYSKTGKNISGYDYLGYKWDSKPSNASDYLTDTPSKNINKIHTIYFVYDEVYVKKHSDITVGKLVAGEFANKKKQFTFTVYFKDENGDAPAAGTVFAYIGGIIASEANTAPANGNLEPDANGKAEFKLSHGQTVTIKDVPVSYSIKIEEDSDNNYSTSYVDSHGDPGTDTVSTGYREVGTEDRAFQFTNLRMPVIQTGLSDDTRSAQALMFFALIVILPGVAAFAKLKRKLSK